MKNLKSLRLTTKYNQSQIAEKLGIPTTTYATYEQNKATPSESMIIKMADFFGCSVDYLIGHETSGIMHLDSFTPTQKEIVELFPSLNEENSRLVKSYIQGLIDGEEDRQAVLSKFNRK